MTSRIAVIDRIEAIIHRDVGRGMQPVFAAARGGLHAAASALARERAPRIGLLTGFFVPGGTPPAAETDGPAAAALLARAFRDAGLTCRVATDTVCAAATRAALAGAGVAEVAVDAAPPGLAVDGIIDAWRRDGVTWALAIERCGPAADGRPRNMRGLDISDHTAALDRLFTAGPWHTIAIGDGGNEIGMGSLPRSLVGQHIPFGDRIACVVPADHLIAAGVSHWGAYALAAALSMLRPDWAGHLRVCLDPALDRVVLAAMVRDGPAVDGVTGRRGATIDAMPLDDHHVVLQEIVGCLP
ncbi:glutamate cyclase domain-containing protein [Rhodopila sp.]|uniref:glutamate cyclase domain-containing protein n=1 Tax=Rhodopila sp. TaxID=2480087 RepID=UPI002C3998F1|nr:glutamate cyclase domain-containing protein [Rhodopila sp.]HVZ08191.1 glutamate cyclase domain-containing protein [Rhodopila sp.]